MGRPNGCNCHCCCCAGDDRSSWPERLNLAATFSGSPIGGCFASPITAELIRRECPTTIITQTVALTGGDSDIDVIAEYVSEPVNVGSCGAATIAIAPWYFPDDSGAAADHVPALWIIHGSGGVAFELIEGTPLLKKTNTLVPCAAEVVVAFTDAAGSPIGVLESAITDSWATIAAAIVTGGWATDSQLWFPESFANGWDIVTLALIAGTASEFAFSSQRGACDPSESSTVHTLDYNNRFHGGQAKWVPVADDFTPTLTASYSSAYGFCMRYAEDDGDCGDDSLTAGGRLYFAPTSPSFHHGSAPFAALAKTRLGTHGPLFLVGLTCRATIVTPADDAQHPKGFTEAIGETPCSDCGVDGATMIVTTTTPTKDGTPVSGYTPRTAELTDCVPCDTSGTTPAERNATGASYDRRGIVKAAVAAMTVKRNWTLTTPNSPPATFTLTINGQTTAAISTTASAATIQTALEALSNVVPGDVICGDGPLPTAVTLEWTGNFETRTAITFTGNSGIVLTCLSQRDDVARFRSDDPVDTNYSGTDSLSHTKTTAVVTTPDSTRFVTVSEDDDEPPLLFPDGANLVKANCNKQYRNTPYESIVATVKDVSYDAGVVNDLFWPNDLIDGATAPIEITGTVTAPDTFEIGPTSSNVQTYSAQRGGKDGLIYRGYGCDPLYGGRYITATGDAFSQSRILTILTDVGNLSSYSFEFDDPGVSTQTEFDRVAQRIHDCGVFNLVGIYSKRSVQLGPRFYGGSAPFPLYVILEFYPRTLSAFFQGLLGTIGGLIGTNNSDPDNPLYKQYGDPLDGLPVQEGDCEDPFSLSDGVKDGPFTEIEFNGYQILSSSTSIDPCNARVTTTINYRVFWIKRVPVDSSGSYASASPPFTYTRNAFFQYGFADNHIATFGSDVSTDLALRPNLEKDRVITLDFESDVITARGYLAPDLTGTASRTLTTMPTSLAWSAFVTYMTSMPYSGSAGLTSPVSTIGSMPWPGGVAAPLVIDFSGATVDVTLESGFGAHDIVNAADTFRYTLPSSFPVDWAGEHELLADTNEPQWVEEVADAPFVKAMLSPYEWTLTLFDADCSEEIVTQVVPFLNVTGVRREPRRVVARYRLPCNQRQRFDTNGANTLELVSCDQSVANWPSTLRVSP